LFDCTSNAAANGKESYIDVMRDQRPVGVSECSGQEGTRNYVDLSVQVVPVIAAGFTDSVAGAGFRSTSVGAASIVAAKREVRSVSCILISDQP
jgi:hypothetical protein